MYPGQPVTVEIDAYPDHDLHGTVQSIQAGSGAAFSMLPPENATGNYVKIVQRVPVKIVFDKPPNEPGGRHPLAPGMSVVPKVKVR
jgi:membrane fusion protein (multidrug efflux system)